MSSYDYVATIDVTRDDLKSKMPTPVDENMSKLQVDFRELLEGILYTEKEIQTLLNPRTRAILEGIAASYHEPAVYRAFEILYEDYAPLRLAGRVVYRELRKVMDNSIQYHKSEIDTIIKITGMSPSSIDECWSSYSQITNDRNIPITELEDYIGPEPLKAILNNNHVPISTEAEEISFGQLVVGLYEYAKNSKNDGSSSTFTKIEPSGNILNSFLGSNNAKRKEKILDPKIQKYDQRYDYMLAKFAKWKPFIPSGDGRRIQIMKGCFVGSENPAVVQALRIIYCDYAALRIAGDFIFKIVSALMIPIVRRHNRRQESLHTQ